MAENEFRVLGPPGTGKTRYLIRQIEKAAEKHGADNIVVASYTRTAAATLIGRQTTIPNENIGTLHALCYRALGSPEIAEINAASFNEEYPASAISLASNGKMDEMAADAVFETEGDRHLATFNLFRAKCMDLALMPKSTIEWVKRWDLWKMRNKFIDFTDMIDLALIVGDPLPGEPQIGIYDECQDFNRLEFRLLRHWAQFQEYVILAGDDDQCIFGFTGASPEAFTDPEIPPENKRILRQSYRLPRVIHRYSQEWIQQITDRESKEFDPKDEEGSIIYSRSTYKTPQWAVEYAAKQAQEGKTTMILTSCGYMLNSVKDCLRDFGLTFHNPYRVTRSDWNPLGNFNPEKGGKRITTRARIIAFLNETLSVSGKPYWNMQDLSRWLELVRIKGVLKKGAKEKIIEILDSQAGMYSGSEEDFYREIFEDFALEKALDRNIPWFRSVLLAAKAKVVEYPLKIYEKHGLEALRSRPRIIIGTVHCSPGDEKILTTDGEIQMQDLDPNKHRLASYMPKCNRLAWGGRNSRTGSPRKDMGYPFIVAKNPYHGKMITLKTEVSKTRVTPNHRVQVRFNERFFEKWVVYLMKRGDWWRVGYCVSGHRPYKSGGITGRLATEQADSAWILKVCCSREDAIYYESIIQQQYGIPGLTFEAAKTRSLSSEMLHKIHDASKDFVNKRIDALCSDFNILKNDPLWTRQTQVVQKRNMRGMFLTVAANILDQYMEILTPESSFIHNRMERKFNHKPIWRTVSVSIDDFTGDVYSLEVLPYHHYISGGAVVHNSVKGGEADNVILFPDVSLNAMTEYQKNRDPVIRTFYVGMTRARENLVICRPVSDLCVKLH